VTHLRADIESAAFPIAFGGKVRRQFGIIIVRHVFNDEHAFLANGIDAQCARDRWLIETTCQRRDNEYVVRAYLGDSERASKRVRRLTALRLRRLTPVLCRIKVFGALEVRNGENQANPNFFGLYCFGKSGSSHVLLVPKLATERNLVTIRSVFNLTHNGQCLRPQR
jgi:hypothetical protein